MSSTLPTREVPSPSNSLIVYWKQVFDNACLYGPRMVAALLLAAPTERFSQAAQAARQTLL